MRNASWKYTGVAALVSTLAACSDFLEVQDPGRYTDAALNTPIALEAVANGVENDVMVLLDDMALAQGLLSDEYMHTGTWTEWEQIDNGEGRPGNSSDYGLQGTMVQRRTAAQKAQERFLTVLGDSANRTEIMARVIAAEAWANLLMGMHNCESPPAPGAAPVPDVEMYKLSIPIFTRAIDVARAANSTMYLQMATAGRARANLLAGNLDAALTDAGTLPDNFLFTAKFSDTGPTNSIVQLSHSSRNKAGGLDQIHWAHVDTIAGFMIDPWSGQLDRRLKFSHPPRVMGVDGTTPHYNEEKYTTIADDIPMTHGWEMRLIEAEVYMRKGDFARAMERINKVRANADLDPVSASTQEDVQKYLLWERFSQLFLEGHRANDLARFGLAGQLGPNRATKFPLNTTELNLNSNTAGNASGRCPALT